MNKNYFKIFLLLICLFFYKLNVFAQDDCESKTGYESYNCKIKAYCEKYKENNVVFNTEPYKEDAESSTGGSLLDEASDNYKENMNSIYNCAILKTQQNSINLIKEKISYLDKTGDIKKSILPKIDSMNTKIDLLSKSGDCVNIDKTSTINKLSVLRQATYETCKYSFYMYYLGNILQNDISKSANFPKDSQSMNIKELQENITKVNDGINQDVKKAYDVFPIAYHAYIEYENNFPIHFLLEILKEDFIIFREKLYQALNPINQLIYKISNAMSK